MKTKNIDTLSLKEKSKLLNLIRAKKKSGDIVKVKRGIEETILEASTVQKWFWIMNSFNLNSPANNFALAYLIDGPLDVNLLRRSIIELSIRYEIFRTTYYEENEKIFQRIKNNNLKNEDYVKFLIQESVLDYSNDNKDLLKQNIADDAEKIFDLTNGPLFIVKIYKIDVDRNIIAFITHHILFDGWSIGLFNRELSKIYNSFLGGNEPELLKLEYQYADYTNWMNLQQKADKYQKQIAYWKAQLNGVNTCIRFPEEDGNIIRDNIAKKICFEISDDLFEKLKIYALSNNCTLFNLLLSAYAILLTDYTAEENFCIGIPVSGRHHPFTESMMGCFINVLPYKSEIDLNQEISSILQDCKIKMLNLFDNWDVAIADIIEAVKPEKVAGKNLLYQVIFNMDNPNSSGLNFDNTQIQEIEIPDRTASFDIRLNINENQEGLKGSIIFNSTLFTTETIEKFFHYYVELLNSIVDSGFVSLKNYSNSNKGFGNLKSSYGIQKWANRYFNKVRHYSDEMFQSSDFLNFNTFSNGGANARQLIEGRGSGNIKITHAHALVALKVLLSRYLAINQFLIHTNSNELDKIVPVLVDISGTEKLSDEINQFKHFSYFLENYISLFDNDSYEVIDSISKYFLLFNTKRKKDNSNGIIFSINTDGHDFEIKISYNTDLADTVSVQGLLTQFIYILENWAQLTEIPIDQINFLPEQEYGKIINGFNNTASLYDKNKGVVDLFQENVKVYFNKIAVLDENQELSYGELDQLSSKIAEYLIHKQIGQNSVVGLLLDRSVLLLAAMLGIMKAGAAYLPLDPAFPENRIKYMLNQSETDFILGQKDIFDTLNLENIQFINIFDAKQFEGNENKGKYFYNPDKLMYLLYTSGSSGKPKGVRILNYNVVNFLLAMSKKPGFTSEDKLLAITTICFDISVLELLLPIICGGTLEIVSKESALDSFKLKDLLEQSDATVFQATPATYAGLLSAGWKNKTNVRCFCGGEALSRELGASLLNVSKELWNLFGPTETTVWSSCKLITDADKITIGSPIDNTRFYILDKYNRPAPIGVAGELWVSGDGVADGYEKRNDLTEKTFKPDPFYPGDKMYKTGDLARWIPRGEVEYLGRIDFQVKIRGFRIELGEIETRLLEIPDIDEAVVVALKDKEGFDILGAMIKSNMIVDVKRIQAELKNELPYYMIPNKIVQVDSFPQTLNQKIDRKKISTIISENSLNPKKHNEGKRTNIAYIQGWRRKLITKRNIKLPQASYFLFEGKINFTKNLLEYFYFENTDISQVKIGKEFIQNGNSITFNPYDHISLNRFITHINKSSYANIILLYPIYLNKIDTIKKEYEFFYNFLNSLQNSEKEIRIILLSFNAISLTDNDSIKPEINIFAESMDKISKSGNVFVQCIDFLNYNKTDNSQISKNLLEEIKNRELDHFILYRTSGRWIKNFEQFDCSELLQNRSSSLINKGNYLIIGDSDERTLSFIEKLLLETESRIFLCSNHVSKDAKANQATFSFLEKINKNKANKDRIVILYGDIHSYQVLSKMTERIMEEYNDINGVYCFWNKFFIDDKKDYKISLKNMLIEFNSLNSYISYLNNCSTDFFILNIDNDAKLSPSYKLSQSISASYISSMFKTDNSLSINRMVLMTDGILNRGIDLLFHLNNIISQENSIYFVSDSLNRDVKILGLEKSEEEVKKGLESIWKDLLGVDEVQGNDNFFGIGGHSLLAIKLVNRIKNDYKVDLSLEKLLKDTTIGGLSKVISKEVENSKIGLSSKKLPLLPSQRKYWNIMETERFEKKSLIFRLLEKLGKSRLNQKDFDHRPLHLKKNVCVYKVNTDLAVEKIETIIMNILKFQEVLKYNVSNTDSEVFQLYLRNLDVNYDYIELNDVEDRKQLDKIVTEKIYKRLEDQNLFFSCDLIKSIQNEFTIILILSPVLFDSYSGFIFLQELLNKIVIKNDRLNDSQFKDAGSYSNAINNCLHSYLKTDTAINYWESKIQEYTKIFHTAKVVRKNDYITENIDCSSNNFKIYFENIEHQSKLIGHVCYELSHYLNQHILPIMSFDYRDKINAPNLMGQFEHYFPLMIKEFKNSEQVIRDVKQLVLEINDIKGISLDYVVNKLNYEKNIIETGSILFRFIKLNHATNFNIIFKNKLSYLNMNNNPLVLNFIDYGNYSSCVMTISNNFLNKVQIFKIKEVISKLY